MRLKEGRRVWGLQRQADGNKKGDLEGGGENGSHVDRLGWEVGGAPETFSL